MNDRIVKLEMTQKFHDKEIKELKISNKTLKESFDTLTDNLTAIKNWVIGGVAFAVLEQIGRLSVLNKIILQGN